MGENRTLPETKDRQMTNPTPTSDLPELSIDGTTSGLPDMSIDGTTSGLPDMSIDGYKQLWVDCEEEKTEPRVLLKQIGKRQRPATMAIREFMEENQLESLDCGSGWTMTYSEVDKLTFSEDVCSAYMPAEALLRLKKEQTTRRPAFKTLPPPKRQRMAE